MKFLFVCTGNTCRSVMAHQLFKKMLSEKHLKEPEWSVKSCGIAAHPAYPVPVVVREILKSRNVPLFSHIPSAASQELMEWADLVLGMTHEHTRALESDYPNAQKKIHLLKEFSGLPEPWEIPDPIGLEETTYRACLEEIESGLKELLKKCIKT
ncbi:MAG: low molecular weight protein arginine phosphatase [Elusimicrobia bacterium]|nr:low molecular weight protein arginine phosphatase [Elusimicrobiota bacterium]